MGSCEFYHVVPCRRAVYLDDRRQGRDCPKQSTGATMDIKRSGSQSSGKGPAEYFTGTVRIDPLFQPPPPARALGVSVTFEQCALNAWLTNPLCQTRIIVDGRCIVQRHGC